jgi:NagD protein
MCIKECLPGRTGWHLQASRTAVLTPVRQTTMETNTAMADAPPIRDCLMDMDGVIVHEERAIPGAERFISRLREAGHPLLVLTNNSMYTARDLAVRLAHSGITVTESDIWTSALATAQFLSSSVPTEARL